jgi:glycosyltransferase involved in cell wall biosynthesis
VTCFATWVEEDGLNRDEPFTILRPRIRRGYRWDWPHRSLAAQAAGYIRRHDPDAVFVVGVTRLCRFLLESHAADRLLVWELTDGEGNKFVDEQACRLLGKCRAVLAPSETVERNLRKTYRYDGAISRLPFWIEDENLPYLPPPEMSLADFLFLGRREDEKGLRELIEATGIVSKEYPDISVCIGGFGETAPYRKQVADLQLERQVFFREYPKRSDAMGALAASRFLVLPSYHEGYPLVLLEAAQRSVPFLATSVGSVPEIFGGTPAAVIISPRDAKSLATEMRNRLVESPELYAERRKSAYGFFSALSSAPSVTSNIRSALEQVGRVKPFSEELLIK